MKTKIVSIETIPGRPLTAAGRTITPVIQSVALRLPERFPFAAGLVWTRPVAVQVTAGDQITRIPIFNATRLLILLLTGLMITTWLIIWLGSDLLRGRAGRNRA